MAGRATVKKYRDREGPAGRGRPALHQQACIDRSNSHAVAVLDGFINAFPFVRHVPQRLKPAFCWALNGTAEEAAEKVVERAKSTPRALKREQI